MVTIKLLDCTLRDGGYVNDFNFNDKNIGLISENLALSGIDLIEIGFLKNVNSVCALNIPTLGRWSRNSNSQYS